MHHFLNRRTKEERKQVRQLFLAVAGIVSLIFIFVFVGLPSYIKLSSFIANFKNETPQTNNESEIIQEPVLDSTLEATNSAKVTISGRAMEGQIVLLYVNGSKKDEEIVGKDAVFDFKNISLNKGPNEIFAKAKVNDKESPASNKLSIVFDNEPPVLDIESPKNNEEFKRDQKDIVIKGKTEEDATLYINDRFIYVEKDGSFTENYRLNDGDNKIQFKALDLAGNSITKDITVKYSP